MIDVEIISEISQEVFSEHSSVLVNCSKVLGATIFLVASAKKFMSQFAQKGTVSPDSKEGWGPHDILRILLMMTLIVFIPEILSLIDKILNGVLGLFVDDLGPKLTAMELSDLDVPEHSEEDSILHALLKTALDIKRSIHPISILNSFIISASYYLDILIFLIYLGKRFFALGVIKIISPLLVAFAIFPKYQELVYNIGKVYVRTFLTIIPLLLVNVFANEFYATFMGYMTGTVGKTATMVAGGETIKAVTLLGFIWLKFKLFKYSSEIMKSLWP